MIINDAADGRYRDLPEGASVVINPQPAGFAVNANTGLERLFAEHDLVFCVNFDLDLEAEVFDRLESDARRSPAALVAPVLSDSYGRPVFSAGSRPSPLKEFTRAAGLRSGQAQRILRALLRRRRAWRGRNAPRVLCAEEYLPWTLVAVRRDAWRQVGPLDERFPMYAEDIDWGIRCTALGWECRLVDVGRVVHEERGTAGPVTNALYEVSHARLHAKLGARSNAVWQRRGLALRRSLLRPVTAEIDWEVVDEGAVADAASVSPR